ncbi:MAG: AAA family ATPase [Candidatus Dormibacteria bacterium]
MRLAIVGKGGVGKTTIAGTLARILAKRGRRVLALDLDPNPGLGYSVGLTPRETMLPEGISVHTEGLPRPFAWRLNGDTSATAELERYAEPGPDGILYLCPGKILGASFLDDHSLMAVRDIVRGVSDSGWDIITDIDAATAVSCGRFLEFAEQCYVLTTPQPASAITARRLQDLLIAWPLTMVASMSRGETAHAGLEPALRIPFDESVKAADRRGVPLVDAFPDSPVVAAVDRLATELLAADAASNRG